MWNFVLWFDIHVRHNRDEKENLMNNLGLCALVLSSFLLDGAIMLLVNDKFIMLRILGSVMLAVSLLFTLIIADIQRNTR